MREIKFRAWNKIWKMMSMVDKIEFEDGKPYSVSTTIEATDFDHTDEWCDYEVGDEIILQQFTGLLDKNGKEIYEGDILNIKFVCWPNVEYNYKFNGYYKIEIGKFRLQLDLVKLIEPKETFDHIHLDEDLTYNFKEDKFEQLAIDNYHRDGEKVRDFTSDIEVIGNIFENQELLN